MKTIFETHTMRKVIDCDHTDIDIEVEINYKDKSITLAENDLYGLEDFSFDMIDQIINEQKGILQALKETKKHLKL